MGRQKKGNANAQRNNNAKKQGKKNNPSGDTEFATMDTPVGTKAYAEMEVNKMSKELKK